MTLQLVEDTAMMQALSVNLGKIGRSIQIEVRHHSVPKTVQALAQARSLVAYAEMLLLDELTRLKLSAEAHQ